MNLFEKLTPRIRHSDPEESHKGNGHVPSYIKPIDAELQRKRAESKEMQQNVDGIVQMLCIGFPDTALELAKRSELSRSCIQHLEIVTENYHRGDDYRGSMEGRVQE